MAVRFAAGWREVILPKQVEDVVFLPRNVNTELLLDPTCRGDLMICIDFAKCEVTRQYNEGLMGLEC